MSERLFPAVEYSLAYKLNTLSGSIGPIHIATPDFDWDKNYDGSTRSLPFTVVRFIEEYDQNAFVSGGQHIDPEWTFAVSVCERNFNQLRSSIGLIQGCLRNATATLSGVTYYYESYPGLPLVDSQSNNRVVGVLNLDLFNTASDQISSSKSTWDNLKYANHILLKLSPVIKDITKDLL